jgi:hypothetical protein
VAVAVQFLITLHQVLTTLVVVEDKAKVVTMVVTLVLLAKVQVAEVVIDIEVQVVVVQE